MDSFIHSNHLLPNCAVCGDSSTRLSLGRPGGERDKFGSTLASNTGARIRADGTDLQGTESE